ncbi:hypothetical protein T439DRAFT_382245 [Meredithblackwellia eburnea MCA 4105]
MALARREQFELERALSLSLKQQQHHNLVPSPGASLRGTIENSSFPGMNATGVDGDGDGDGEMEGTEEIDSFTTGSKQKQGKGREPTQLSEIMSFGDSTGLGAKSNMDRDEADDDDDEEDLVLEDSEEERERGLSIDHSGGGMLSAITNLPSSAVPSHSHSLTRSPSAPLPASRLPSPVISRSFSTNTTNPSSRKRTRTSTVSVSVIVQPKTKRRAVSNVSGGSASTRKGKGREGAGGAQTGISTEFVDSEDDASFPAGGAGGDDADGDDEDELALRPAKNTSQPKKRTLVIDSSSSPSHLSLPTTIATTTSSSSRRRRQPEALSSDGTGHLEIERYVRHIGEKQELEDSDFEGDARGGKGKRKPKARPKKKDEVKFKDVAKEMTTAKGRPKRGTKARPPVLDSSTVDDGEENIGSGVVEEVPATVAKTSSSAKGKTTKGKRGRKGVVADSESEALASEGGHMVDPSKAMTDCETEAEDEEVVEAVGREGKGKPRRKMVIDDDEDEEGTTTTTAATSSALPTPISPSKTKASSRSKGKSVQSRIDLVMQAAVDATPREVWGLPGRGEKMGKGAVDNLKEESEKIQDKDGGDGDDEQDPNEEKDGEEDEAPHKSSQSSSTSNNSFKKPALPLKPKSTNTAVKREGSAAPSNPVKRGLAGVMEKQKIWGHKRPGLSNKQRIPRLHTNLKPPPPPKPAIPKQKERKKKGEEDYSDEEKPWYETKHPEEWDSDDREEFAKVQRRKERGWSP